MRKPTVAVLFGGRSSEHGVSCVTAGGVLGALDRDSYDVSGPPVAPCTVSRSPHRSGSHSTGCVARISISRRTNHSRSAYSLARSQSIHDVSLFWL